MKAQKHVAFFDIGVNLTSNQFRDKMPAVLERAAQAGISDLIAIASDQHESQTLHELPPMKSPRVWLTSGIHPHQAKTFDATSFDIIRSCAQNERCIAIGECGLDYNRMYSPQSTQTSVFEVQIELAQELKYPLYLHERDAHEDFTSILRSHHQGHSVCGVVHCFTGNRDHLKQYLDLGLYVGITGWVCDERRGDELRASLKYIPQDRLLIETDAPYLRPRTYKGSLKVKGNEPCLLPHIAEHIAELIGENTAAIAARSMANARRLFGLSLSEVDEENT